MWYCRVAIYEKQPFFVIKTCMYISRMMHLVKLDVDKDFPPNVFQRNRRPVPKKLLLNGVPEAPSKSRRQNKNSVFQFEITQSLPPSQDDLPKSKGSRPREVGGVDNACLTQFILALEQKEKSSWVGSKERGMAFY